MLTALVAVALSQAQTITLPPGPGPLDNPLKGFSSYCEPGVTLNCPVTMAYEYTSFKSIEPKEGQFDWSKWEDKWEEGSAKGKDVILRIVMDYPHEPLFTPQWLIDKGVKMTHYDDYGGGYSPDYNNPETVKAMLDCIKAFGKRYDHNDRVAGIVLGFLGFWGEWHTYPKMELFANGQTQKAVVEAMHKAFPDKPILARNASYPSCQVPWLGYHDDMIPDDTLGPEDWRFANQIKNGGVGGNWKSEPLGGEMVPRAAAQYLGKDWALLQDAVKTLHFSWIGPYCPAMLKDPNDEQLDRIHQLIRMLGYQFKLKTARLDPATLRLTGVNEGVAPLYADWKPKFVLIDSQNQVVKVIPTDADPRKWLPGEFGVKATVAVQAPAGSYRVGFGIVDPQQDKARVKFANELASVDGFTILGKIEIPK